VRAGSGRSRCPRLSWPLRARARGSRLRGSMTDLATHDEWNRPIQYLYFTQLKDGGVEPIKIGLSASLLTVSLARRPGRSSPTPGSRICLDHGGVGTTTRHALPNESTKSSWSAGSLHLPSGECAASCNGSARDEAPAHSASFRALLTRRPRPLAHQAEAERTGARSALRRLAARLRTTR
jgi:hypothetical protein